MSELDQLVEKLSGPIALAVKKAVEEAKTPSLEEQFTALKGQFSELMEYLQSGDSAADEATDGAAEGDVTKSTGISATDLADALKEITTNVTALSGAVEKMLERQDTVEKSLTGRKSLDGQDGEGSAAKVEKSKGGSIDKVLFQLGRSAKNGQQGSLTLR